MKIFIISLIILILNIPFGYWRGNVKKFSLQWILSVHIPVPFVIFLRIYSNIGFEFYTYIFLVSAFFIGQKLGYILHSWYLNKYNNVSAFLFYDLYKIKKNE